MTPYSVEGSGGADLMELQPRLLSLQEAARYLGHSPKWLYSRTGARGKERLPFRVLKVGKRCFFDRVALDAWIDSLGVEVNLNHD